MSNIINNNIGMYLDKSFERGPQYINVEALAPLAAGGDIIVNASSFEDDPSKFDVTAVITTRDIVAGIDNDAESLITFSKNHSKATTINFDLSQKIDFSSNEFSSLNNVKIDIVIGGPPCQGFSVAGKRHELDPRNSLYKTYVSFIKKFAPKIMVMENVPTIMSMYGGRVYENIVSELESLGYTTSSFILD